METRIGVRTKGTDGDWPGRVLATGALATGALALQPAMLAGRIGAARALVPPLVTYAAMGTGLLRVTVQMCTVCC